MIFLFKDHTYDVIDPLTDDEKIPKKIEKVRDKLKAVLFEFNTRLHHDTFIVVDAEHLVTNFKHFAITYSMSIVGDDLPIDDANTVTRTIVVEDVISYYQIASLIYQLEYSNDVGDDLCLGDTRVMLSALSYREMGEKDELIWDPDEEPATKFINRQGLYCDTDDFLAISVDDADRVEAGCYITRRNHEGYTHLEYHYHDIKNILWLKHGKWYVFPENTIARLSDGDYIFRNPTQEIVEGIFGICINRSSLIYLTDYATLENYRQVEQCTIIAKRGSWGTIETDRDVQNMTYNGDIMLEVEYERSLDAFNMPDMLYMAVYLPQYWDMERYLFHIEPLILEIEVLQCKRYYKSASYTVPVVKDGEGLNLDLFTIFAMIMKMQPHKVREFE